MAATRLLAFLVVFLRILAFSAAGEEATNETEPDEVAERKPMKEEAKAIKEAQASYEKTVRRSDEAIRRVEDMIPYVPWKGNNSGVARTIAEQGEDLEAGDLEAAEKEFDERLAAIKHFNASAAMDGGDAHHGRELLWGLAKRAFRAAERVERAGREQAQDRTGNLRGDAKHKVEDVFDVVQEVVERRIDGEVHEAERRRKALDKEVRGAVEEPMDELDHALKAEETKKKQAVENKEKKGKKEEEDAPEEKQTEEAKENKGDEKERDMKAEEENEGKATEENKSTDEGEEEQEKEEEEREEKEQEEKKKKADEQKETKVEKTEERDNEDKEKEEDDTEETDAKEEKQKAADEDSDKTKAKDETDETDSDQTKSREEAPPAATALPGSPDAAVEGASSSSLWAVATLVLVGGVASVAWRSRQRARALEVRQRLLLG